jgi:ParB family chromosome partitioning protein
MSKNDPRKALGKGLHSLLPSKPKAPEPAPQPIPIPPASRNGGVQTLLIEHVIANPDQPRRDFEEGALLELAQSIEVDGIIQPLLVRKMGPNQYQIIAGERRWRAAKIAGLTEVPVIVREANDEKVLELAIIENIQREDLNAIELALAFQRMAIELGLSHDQIGQKTGKQRVTITNSLRLLQLPVDLQQLVATNQLSSGHARALLKFEDDQMRRDIAARCVAEGWSVRQIEQFTRPAGALGAGGKKDKTEPAPIDPNVKFAIDEMERTLGTRVRIVEKGSKKGQIEIEFYSQDDLNRLYEAIVASALA